MNSLANQKNMYNNFMTIRNNQECQLTQNARYLSKWKMIISLTVKKYT